MVFQIFNFRKKVDEEMGNEIDTIELEGLSESKTRKVKKISASKKNETHYLDNFAKILIPISYTLFIMIYFIYFFSVR